MTRQQFEELKFLIRANAQGIQANAQGGRLERLEGRLTRVEVVQEQHGHDLRAVAEGVTGNAGRLDRLERRFDGLEVSFEHLSASVHVNSTDHEQRLRALED